MFICISFSIIEETDHFIILYQELEAICFEFIYYLVLLGRISNRATIITERSWELDPRLVITTTERRG